MVCLFLVKKIKMCEFCKILYHWYTIIEMKLQAFFEPLIA